MNANELDGDLVSGRLPQYSYYTPNIKNDGHDTGLKFAGEFLHSFFSARLSKFPKGMSYFHLKKISAYSTEQEL